MGSKTFGLAEFLSYVRWVILPPLVVAAWFTPRLGDRWFGAVERGAARLAARKRTAVLAVALVAIVTRLALYWAVATPIPAIHDEFSYLLQADTFLHGRLTNPPHPMWIFLDTFHVLPHPTYMSIFPPGQGWVLAIGQVIGHPWIGVLLSMAAMCAAMTWMMQGWLPPRWALLGAVLVLLRIYLFSYWLESYWGGAVAGAGGALVIGAFPRIIKHQRTRDALLMAIGASLLANSRPFEGFLFCVPVAIALVTWLFSQRSPSFKVTGPRVLLPLLCGLGITLAFVLYDNWSVTGNPLLLPHALYDQQYTNYRVLRWQHLNPPLKYLNPQFDSYFNGWVRETFHPSWHLLWEKCQSWWQFFVGSFLAIPFVALPWVLRDRRTRLPLVLFVWCGLGLFAVVYFEAHYAAPMAAAFFILLVQAMRHLRRWEVRGRPVGIFLTRLVVVLAIVRVGVLAAEAYRHPLLDWSVYRARIVRQLEATPGKQLVIVRYAPDHFAHHEWVYNGADIDGGKVVWAREIPGEDLTPLLRYFRDRKVWIVKADLLPPRLEPYPSESPAQFTTTEGHQSAAIATPREPYRTAGTPVSRKSTLIETKSSW
jgi:hypothetical protein